MKYIYLNGGKDYLSFREGSGGTVEIFDIAVNSERRKGVGKKLVNILLNQLDKEADKPPTVFAVCRSTNKIAHLFYEAVGFRIVANLFDFYKDGVRSDDDRGCVDAVMYGYDIPRNSF